MLHCEDSQPCKCTSLFGKISPAGGPVGETPALGATFSSRARGDVILPGVAGGKRGVWAVAAGVEGAGLVPDTRFSCFPHLAGAGSNIAGAWSCRHGDYGCGHACA